MTEHVRSMRARTHLALAEALLRCGLLQDALGQSTRHLRRSLYICIGVVFDVADFAHHREVQRRVPLWRFVWKHGRHQQIVTFARLSARLLREAQSEARHPDGAFDAQHAGARSFASGARAMLQRGPLEVQGRDEF